MPIYCYECECGHKLEQLDLTFIESKKDKKCPKCGKKMKIVIGAPSFILKGKGWYKDGY